MKSLKLFLYIVVLAGMSSFSADTGKEARAFGGNAIFHGVVKAVFGLICHQEPSRLMLVDGTEVPLCPRCIGLQTGFLVSFVVVSLSIRGRMNYEGKFCRFLLMFAIALTGIHWGLGQMGMIEPGVDPRLLTGLITGAGLGILFQSYRRGRFMPRSTPTVVVSPARAIGVICLSTLLVFVARDMSSWIAFVGIVVVSFLVNVIIVIQTATLVLPGRRHPIPLLYSSNTGGLSWKHVRS